MTEDRTLDAFLDGDDAEDVEPIESTAAWSPEGVDCPRCGTVTHRRFREADGSLVCPDCKRW
ncbi:MAG: hypothetical protein ABEJ57_03950 [Halobacteriaceae archaeon]